MDDMTPTNDMTPMLEISQADRLRVFREDDEALAELAQITHARAIADGGKDNAAGHLDLKIRERRAAMWGYDSPVRFDMVQVTEAKRPSSFEVIEATIRRMVEERPPAQRAALKRLEELGYEKALELLGPGTSDCTSDSIALEKE
jgi:hypothetical protein